MATQTVNFGTRAALTITLASLGNGSYRESTEVDNSVTLAVDGVLHGKITTGTSPTVNTTITVYVSGSDGTTARPGNLTGTDSTITPAGEQTQFEIARIIVVDATSNHTYEFYVGSIAQLFGGVMPKKFSVIVLNGSGVALNATGGNHDIEYTPIKYDIA
jgi:hypothetical protein